ncbi:MAG: hypothetical protein QOJ64_4330 [Acidobacteriota bacterium]|jgi:hypothetical protein|nr:hypothetical protein [Acidobacteriota bacterium]
MKNYRLFPILIIACFLLVCSPASFGQGAGRETTNTSSTNKPSPKATAWTKKEPPTFADFPARVTKATARQINFSSHPKARQFRTQLRESLSEVVDFAGRYIVATWGCGTDCEQSAIIDGKTGNVFFPKQLQGTSLGTVDADEVLEYKENSRLLIINGSPAGPDRKYGIWYYEWTGTTLELLKYVKN